MHCSCFKPITALLFATLCLSSAAARAGDDTIFDARTDQTSMMGDPTPSVQIGGGVDVKGYKKIPPDEAINQWSFDLDSGVVVTNSSANNATNWQNVYLAFAVDVRYARSCFGTKTTVLCTLLHSGVQLSGNMSWNGPQNSPSDRYSVVLVPVEYITGTFGKQGLDLKTTNSAFYATIGLRAEDVRDLGIAVENRITGVISASLNYASTEQGLGPSAAFHWIGSVRLFGGGVGAQMGTSAAAPTVGALTGGVETQIGIALDLAKGSVAFTNTTRLEGDIGFAGYHAGFTTDALEIKYMHSICSRQTTRSGECNAPRSISWGGGIRYEYSTSSYGDNSPTQSQSVQRLILFAELARF